MTIDTDIREAEYFRTSDGMVIPSVLALRAYLRMISKPEFEMHVSDKKNDFADWIQHVFGEDELAKQLRACFSREQMVWVLDDIFAEIHMQRVIADKPEPVMPAIKVNGAPVSADPIVMQQDENFTAVMPELVERNEVIGKKYEEVAKQMQEALLNPMPKEWDQLTEKLRSRYTDLMVKVSETRRSGKDTLLPSLVLRQFNSKLNYARVSREAKDFEFARIVLEEAEFELRIVMEQKEVNVKAEVLAMAGLK